ncbi:tetratricopeptide repeat protein [Planctellipticum variicoloris]|uniref:tetratricopeptide repeat protein n=1 Tax=Planctellipticum variicoloris TaxID=3064265 RepID=UPI003013D9CB|nr:tetratricopeptide repeat protein [Planctomycetaceae bacterium SH412]
MLTLLLLVLLLVCAIIWGSGPFESLRLNGLRLREQSKRRQELGQATAKASVLTLGTDEGASQQDSHVLGLVAEWLGYLLSQRLPKATGGAQFWIQVSFGIVPAGRTIWRLDVSPLSLKPRIRKLLEGWLANPPVLPVQQPLAISFVAAIRGGGLEDPGFLRPFQDLIDKHGTHPLRELLERELGAAIPEWTESLTVEHCDRYLELLPGDLVALRTRADLLIRSSEFDRAIDDLNEVLVREASQAQDYYARGYARIQLERTESGMEDLRQATQRDGEYWPARQLRAEVLQKQGKYSEAIAELDEGLAVAKSAPLWLTRGMIHLELHDEGGAEQDFSEAAALAPDWPEPLLQRGLIRMRQQRADEAVADLDQCVELEQDGRDARRLRARVLFELSRWGRAEEEFTRLLAEDPADPGSRLLHGRCQAMLGKLESAVEDFGVIVDHDEVGLEARAWRAVALTQLERYDDAVPDADQALAADVMPTLMRWVRAVAAWVNEDQAGALRELEQAAELDPDDHMIQYWKAKLLALSGEFEEARSILSDVEWSPDDWQALWLRGAVAAELGDSAAAQRDLSEASENPQASAEVRLTRIKVLHSEGEWCTAVRELDELLAADDENEDACWLRGQILLAQGRPEAAIVDFQRAYDLGVRPPELGGLWSSALLRLEQPDAAREILDRFLKQHPDNPGLLMASAQLTIQAEGPDAADEQLQAAIAVHTEFADSLTVHVLIMEAQWYHEREDYAESERLMTEALSYDTPLTPVAHVIRGAARRYAGNLVEALEDYNAAFEPESDNASVLRCRGQAYTELAEYDQALVDLDQAVPIFERKGIDVELGYALSARSIALGGVERWDEAWRDWDRALVIQPDDAWLHYNAGLLYLGQQQPEKASWCFGLALACENPRLPPVKQARARGFLKSLASGRRKPETDPD